MTRRCQLFEKTVETTAQKKLEIITAFVKNPKTGKATESVEVAGSTATVIFSLIGGITVAVGAAAFGAPAFATALVAGAVLLVKIVDKTLKQANAQEVENIIEEVDVEDKQKMSCYLNCIVKDVAKELSRIFESQIFELQSDKQVEILAESAVELMLDLKEKKKDKFDRDTLLKKVLQDGNMKKKKDLLTSDNKMKKWSAPNVFRKPGLRRIIFGKNGMKFKYSVKPKNTCDPSKYGYRGQFLEVKMYDSKKKCETSCTDKTDENQEICCKDCSSNFENCNGSRYFSESNIDNEYTEPERDKPYAYYPLHILIQCPNVFHSFKQDLEKVSFQEFLKKKSALPEKHFVRPVYRSHSPGNIPDLEKADLTETDFSYANFTKSSLQKCNFSRCVMLFAELQEAKMSGSKFCETFINHSNLKKVVAVSGRRRHFLIRL
jgi:ribosomal protein S15P/S13E